MYPMLALPIYKNSVHLVQWVTKNNRPANIINNHELQNPLTAGQPNIELPSNGTVLQDIHTSFLKYQDHVAKLLWDHPGQLHFATDTWTSPNHCAFITWTVHFEYKGDMLSFLINVIEVPEVCTCNLIQINYC